MQKEEIGRVRSIYEGVFTEDLKKEKEFALGYT